MSQPSIDFSTHAENLDRVSARIGRSILAFCAAVACRKYHLFHADELREYVERHAGKTAPGSADRILRDLRKRGVIRYRVVSRSQSLYELNPQNPTEGVK